MPRGSKSSVIATVLTVPLSETTRELLAGIKPIGAGPHARIFAARIRCQIGRIDDDAMQVFMRDEVGQKSTVHGFRSSIVD
jgi:hypothetical protein